MHIPDEGPNWRDAGNDTSGEAELEDTAPAGTAAWELWRRISSGLSGKLLPLPLEAAE
jgi:hypothetical protein